MILSVKFCSRTGGVTLIFGTLPLGLWTLPLGLFSTHRESPPSPAAFERRGTRLSTRAGATGAVLRYRASPKKSSAECRSRVVPSEWLRSELVLRASLRPRDRARAPARSSVMQRCNAPLTAYSPRSPQTEIWNEPRWKKSGKGWKRSWKFFRKADDTGKIFARGENYFAKSERRLGGGESNSFLNASSQRFKIF